MKETRGLRSKPATYPHYQVCVVPGMKCSYYLDRAEAYDAALAKVIKKGVEVRLLEYSGPVGAILRVPKAYTITPAFVRAALRALPRCKECQAMEALKGLFEEG